MTNKKNDRKHFGLIFIYNSIICLCGSKTAFGFAPPFPLILPKLSRPTDAAICAASSRSSPLGMMNEIDGLLSGGDNNMDNALQLASNLAAGTFMISKTSRDMIVNSNEDRFVVTLLRQIDADRPNEIKKMNPVTVVVKLLGLLVLKGLHDAVYYPSLWIEETTASTDTTTAPGTTELAKTHPMTMVVKLLGLLVLKGLHDAVYYPSVWIEKSLKLEN